MKRISREYYTNGITDFDSVGKVEPDEESVLNGEYVERMSPVLKMPSLDSCNTRGRLAEQITGENPLRLKGLSIVLKDIMKEWPLEIKREPEENIYDDNYEKDVSPSDSENEDRMLSLSSEEENEICQDGDSPLPSSPPMVSQPHMTVYPDEAPPPTSPSPEATSTTSIVETSLQGLAQNRMLSSSSEEEDVICLDGDSPLPPSSLMASQPPMTVYPDEAPPPTSPSPEAQSSTSIVETSLQGLSQVTNQILSSSSEEEDVVCLDGDSPLPPSPPMASEPPTTVYPDEASPPKSPPPEAQSTTFVVETPLQGLAQKMNRMLSSSEEEDDLCPDGDSPLPPSPPMASQPPTTAFLDEALPSALPPLKAESITSVVEAPLQGLEPTTNQMLSSSKKEDDLCPDGDSPLPPSPRVATQLPTTAFLDEALPSALPPPKAESTISVVEAPLQGLEPTTDFLTSLQCTICMTQCSTKDHLTQHLQTLHSSDAEKALTCTECGITFRRKDSLKRHSLKHSKQMETESIQMPLVPAEVPGASSSPLSVHCCMECNKTFQKRYNLTRHMQRVHKSEKMKIGSTQTPSIPAEVPGAPSLPSSVHRCMKCNKTFQNQYNLTCHMSIHKSEPQTTSKPAVYHCTECNRTFQRRYSLNRHMFLHRAGRIMSKDSRSTVSGADVCPATRERIASIPFDAATAPSTSTSDPSDTTTALDEGENSSHNEDISINEVPCTALQDGILCQCSDCSKIVEKVKPLKDVAKTLNEGFSCEKCSKPFFSKYALDRHVETHEPLESIKKFACDICGSAYSTKTYLKYHKLHVHTSKSYKETCSICGKVFINKKSLNSHIRTVHLHVKRYTAFNCEHCGKKFFDSKNCQRHIHQVHLKDVEFICAHCNRVFYDKGALVGHIQDVHLPSGNYKCETCGRLFNSKSRLCSHKNNKHSAKEFHCEICGKVLKSNMKLQLHAAGHSEEKPFVCQTCGKGFKRSCNLKQHLYTHSDSRPHICSICGESFRLRTHVKQHMAVHGLVRKHKCFICSEVFAKKQELYLHLTEHDV